MYGGNMSTSTNENDPTQREGEDGTADVGQPNAVPEETPNREGEDGTAQPGYKAPVGGDDTPAPTPADGTVDAPPAQ
jgi:hypothetical protein